MNTTEELLPGTVISFIPSGRTRRVTVYVQRTTPELRRCVIGHRCRVEGDRAILRGEEHLYLVGREGFEIVRGA